MHRPHRLRLCLLLAPILALASCDTAEPPPSPDQVRAQIVRLLPPKLADRQGWATDIYAAFESLEIRPVTPNLCATLAVIEQESGYRVDPVVPGLAKIARDEIDRRATRMHIPLFVVQGALGFDSPNGQTYEARLAAVRTEKDLNDIFEDFIDSVPMGRRLLGGVNPVHTGGPMQVSIGFAEQYVKARPYPYPLAEDDTVRGEVFTRRGGVYFGVAHLLGYQTSYSSLRYRFADFNAGFYASRNAAFQQAVSIAADARLDLDGDLIGYGRKKKDIGATETALRSLAPALNLSHAQIRRALQRGQTLRFEKTELYERVYALAEQKTGKPLPREMMPRIRLDSPKITRQLTTEWFATRVEGRYRQCLARARK
ncbi:DUF1615 domain-containing protein [Arenimonas oryziterrae]|uniref:DUF1615 domain-containing protein n=1 Tax=Arenimonas oryziterrae DSM 21050 = YC6267 TaxID=1121015 RepID=A0A091B9B5_9GAMM|nr:DUF1615 domain-containing protein [Arenimonas oryziterrae]KFN41030.1 hypothetical protein N789_03875 [Arenimonas oryziterrae DSM 21050 = YC6267]